MGLTVLRVRNQGAIGSVRRKTAEISRDLGFKADRVSELEIVSTELATNLIQHGAVDGMILIRTMDENERLGIEIASVDSGPGIADIDRALGDHFSTRGTSGCGLGAIRRLMDEFDIFSRPAAEAVRVKNGRPDPVGTIVTCRKWVSTPADTRFSRCALSIPCAGETANGDGHFIRENEAGLLIAVADGAGHGVHAQEASHRAIRYISEHPDKPFVDLLLELHEQLRKTRGAALTLLRLDADERTIEHAGIGNVETRTYPREQSGLLTRPGTLGFGQPPRPRVKTADWPIGTMILVHTDGVSARWSLDHLPHLLECSAATVAHYLMHGYRRPTDDATIIAIKEIEIDAAKT